MNPTITPQKYQKLKKKALIIDVRSLLEHQTLPKLPNSINIYYQDLMNNPAKYIKDKNQLVIVYCNFGNRSGQVAEYLHNQGYNVFVLEGGIESYCSTKN
ncbi:rhodanese-like domain-containing protein [endosymbiont GvMRE of Glomus versiforme]|uniref:rhodanese-like domain-containing protein n=1 Tax=endosymbiont GvMRE of Glomus versiforme TaxID=2039283 RepID=UPI000EE3AB07|nr:rhodanese-like domain-containing protein [endosymbiont GvMRE of Glomus versiforme]RHZ35981.1 Sulfurtransferase [endosymbiont GvMRE of Glomus versiforme]